MDKTPDFVRHFDTLLVIRTKKIFPKCLPFVRRKCKKLGSHHLKNAFLGLLKLVIFKKSAEKPFSKAKISSF